MKKEIEEYVQRHYEDTCRLLMQLAAIPAPTGKEEKRAEFVRTWLKEQGAEPVRLDQAGNVVFEYGMPQKDSPEKDLLVFMAHMDVVCPDETPLPVAETDGRLTGPGIQDNTANLVNLMMCVRFLLEHPAPSERSILFVADVGEEGLGNLRGSRRILEEYGKRICGWISLDLNYDTLFVKAVGSVRCRITVRTRGGHSYKDFGAENAIVRMAALVTELYQMQVSEKPKVTYNVGAIEGGTSVNTIAQDASILFEIRSEDQNALNRQQAFLEELLTKKKDAGWDLEWKVLGIRPGGGPRAAGQKSLEECCARVMSRVCRNDLKYEAGSTDSNIPLSCGIPAVTIGTVLGGGTHTRKEWIRKDSMAEGQRALLELACEMLGWEISEQKQQ